MMKTTVTLAGKTGDLVLDVEVANTRLKRTMGLADREERTFMADAMLFVYDIPTSAPFTAEHMLFPLVIAWFDMQGYYLGERTVEAGDPNPVVSPGLYQYVLEFPLSKAKRIEGSRLLL